MGGCGGAEELRHGGQAGKVQPLQRRQWCRVAEIPEAADELAVVAVVAVIVVVVVVVVDVVGVVTSGSVGHGCPIWEMSLGREWLGRRRGVLGLGPARKNVARGNGARTEREEECRGYSQTRADAELGG